MRLVSIDMLESNMVLANDLTYKGLLVLRRGTKNIKRYADKLLKLGINYLYIEDSLGKDIIVPDAITDETRQLCKCTLINTMNALVKHEMTGLDELNISIERIIYDISSKNIKQSLTDIRTYDEYTFSHCISTTVYALLIGKGLNYTKSMLEQLAIGTLLHDIGKILLDGSILYKKEKLTYSELQYVKQHVDRGYDYIKDFPNIPDSSKRIVLSHHERLDGSGYPNAIKGYQLDEFSRIVGIADVYDALISERCYRKKWKTNKAIKFLLENSNTKFDTELVRIFMQNIAIYPNGTTVCLSDGRHALVKEQNQNMPLRPVVRVFSDAQGHAIPWEEIDLMKVLSLTIIDSELEINQGPSWAAIDI